MSIERLQHILFEHQVGRSADIAALPRETRKHLDRSVYGWFASFKDGYIAELQGQDGLNLCLKWDSRLKAFHEASTSATVVKKLVVLSCSGVVLTPKFHHPDSGQRPSVPDVWYHLVLDFLPLVRSGFLRIVPQAVRMLVPSLQGNNFVIVTRHRKLVGQDWLLLKQEVPSLRIMSLSEARLRHQMLEMDASQTRVPGRNLYVYLPHLSDVSMDTLASIRNHHGDVFVRYNTAMAKFFMKSARSTNETTLLEALRETDEQIRLIQADMDKIVKSQVLSAGGVVVGLAAAFLWPFTSGECAHTVAGILGGNAIREGLNFFRGTIERKHLAARSDFHFPWLIHQSSRSNRDR